MVQLRQATARLRLFLAEIRSREEQLDNTIRQFRTQLNRLPRQAMYGRITLDIVLSSMAEIQERLNYAQATRQHLLAIKQKATDELSALELTQKVEEAKEALKDLKSKSDGAASVDDGVVAEMRRLEEFIAEYSKQAERAITSSFQEGEL
ncbi:MAG: hypothetical protein J4F46_05780 [Dehalococcoidia bacterium]|nr:hypothetical protein [Dehalococcoidia bacterium]